VTVPVALDVLWCTGVPELPPVLDVVLRLWLELPVGFSLVCWLPPASPSFLELFGGWPLVLLPALLHYEIFICSSFLFSFVR